MNEEELALPSRSEMAAIKEAARKYVSLDKFRSYINGRCGRNRRLAWDAEGLLADWYEQFKPRGKCHAQISG